MFQYALGRHIAIREKTRLALDATLLFDPSARRNYVRRRFDLEIFTLPAECTVLSQVAQILPLPRVFDYSSRATTALKSAIGLERYYREASFRYDERIWEQTGKVYLDGYWQSEKYFRAISQTIRQDFTLREQSEAALMLGGVIAGEPSVCINVRRTDFTAGPSATTHGVVGLEYYRQALDLMVGRCQNARYYIFSDDIRWCRTELVPIIPKRCTVVTHDYAGPAFRDYLWLMTQCTHFIIPNSTFGWWAAWLSTSPDKIVIAPDPWFADRSIDTSDLLPSSWIRLPRSGLQQQAGSSDLLSQLVTSEGA